MKSSFVDGTVPERMKSPSTEPGPTDGSWSVSPTHTTTAASGRAFRRSHASRMSIIDVSSKTKTSPSSRLSPSNVNLFVTGFHLSSRWIVCASDPTDSVMRFAARPVGAARTTFSFLTP